MPDAAWRLDHYNLICYGNLEADVFRRSSGSTTFERDRVFEHTSNALREQYTDNSVDLEMLPTLILGECTLGADNNTPAYFSRLTGVHDRGANLGFEYRHLSNKLTSEEVFGSGYFNVDRYENYRTHWAVKEGNLIDQLFTLFESKAGSDRPRFFDVDPWPLPQRDHIAVMMPFAAEFDPVYESIKIACDESGCPSLRVDDIYGPNKIVNDAFCTIDQSRVVVCDLTNKNPNVLYETGLAHARGCEVILLTQNDQDVPFDLGQIRYIKYLPNKEGLAQLQEQLTSFITVCLSR